VLKLRIKMSQCCIILNNMLKNLPVMTLFSEIISIGGKNWQICGKKYIGEGSGGCLRPPAGPGQILGRGFRWAKPPGRKRDLAFWGHFSWPLRLSDSQF
jgi:hypothetical protein